MDRHVLDSLGYILRAHDRAIDACAVADLSAARRAIALLRSGLVGDSTASHGFDAIYAACDRSLATGDFAGPAQRLAALRDAWCRVVEPSPIFPRSPIPVA